MAGVNDFTLEIAHKSFGQAGRAPTPGNPAAWEPPLLGK